MYQRLVDQGSDRAGRGIGADTAFDPTLLMVDAQPKQGVDPASCEKAIYEELERVKTTLVSDQELEKAKNIRLVEFYQQMRTISGRANTIGTYEVFLWRLPQACLTRRRITAR